MADDGADDGTQPEMRVSNDERNAVVDLLRDQTSAGRLTLGEFEERLDEVYGARTASQLRHALRELPVEPPPIVRAGQAGVVTAGAVTDGDLRRRYRNRLRGEATGFLMPNVVCNAVWFMTGADYWWPGWVLMGTSVGFVSMLLRGFDPERERTELLRERRRQAIAEIEARHPERARGRREWDPDDDDDQGR